MKSVDKIAKVVSKVLEIVHFVAAALMGTAAVCALVVPQYIGYFVEFEPAENVVELETYGFEVTAVVSNGMPDMMVFSLFAVASCIILLLMALVFRNIYSIIRKSEESTPFQKDNVRMLKEIGIFSIAVPAVGFVMGIIIQIVAGFDAVEISNSMTGFIMGIIVLCLTQFFAHGVELEDDVEGLL